MQPPQSDLPDAVRLIAAQLDTCVRSEGGPSSPACRRLAEELGRMARRSGMTAPAALRLFRTAAGLPAHPTAAPVVTLLAVELTAAQTVVDWAVDAFYAHSPSRGVRAID